MDAFIAGRGIIVDPVEMMTDQQILGETIIDRDIPASKSFGMVQWLAKRRLIRNSSICPRCPDNQAMTLIKRVKLSDGVIWRCKVCSKTQSIRANSFFSNSHLDLDQLVVILRNWAKDELQTSIAMNAKMNVHNSSNRSIIDWCCFCRNVCNEFFIRNPISIGGIDEDGTSKVVEIGEFKYLHGKHHRNQWREGHWVFGGIERGTGKCFLVEVPQRTAETLSALIEQYILPGTIIISNGWASYSNISKIGGGIYDHRSISNENNFVHPDDPEVHTQNIENTWMRAKRKLTRQFGTSNAFFESYLHEFLWRNYFTKQNVFGNFLLCIIQQYDLS